MNILLLEPFFSGSHKSWAEGYAKHSQHKIKILSLPGKHWKWRMHGGAVALAEQYLKLKEKSDLILATSMLDLTTFLALTREKTANIPVIMYFHENQLTYPWSPDDNGVKLGQDLHYGFINYASALAADQVLFNSAYHRESFTEALERFLRIYPDKRNLENIDKIREKSQVMYLGMDLSLFDSYSSKRTYNVPVILWNHRWEYDKNPEEFFKILYVLSEKGLDFKLIVLGESYAQSPAIFAEAKEKLQKHIIHFGFVPDFKTYAELIWQSDILPVTSHQDFFGGSIVEAIYCNTFPLLPKRLAYPEHIPKELHKEHLYENSIELIEKLNVLIRTFDLNANISVRQYVTQYDWRNSINIYDNFADTLMSAN